MTRRQELVSSDCPHVSLVTLHTQIVAAQYELISRYTSTRADTLDLEAGHDLRPFKIRMNTYYIYRCVLSCRPVVWKATKFSLVEAAGIASLAGAGKSGSQPRSGRVPRRRCRSGECQVSCQRARNHRIGHTDLPRMTATRVVSHEHKESSYSNLSGLYQRVDSSWIQCICGDG